MKVNKRSLHILLGWSWTLLAIGWTWFFIYIESRAPLPDCDVPFSVAKENKYEDSVLKKIATLTTEWEIRRDSRTLSSLIAAHADLGSFYAESFLSLKADFQFRACLELARNFAKKDARLLASVLNTVAHWKRQMGQLDQAQGYLMQAVQIDKAPASDGQILDLARDYDNLGIVMFMKGEATSGLAERRRLFEQARSFFHQSTELLTSRPQFMKQRDIEDLFGIASANYELASKELEFPD